MNFTKSWTLLRSRLYYHGWMKQLVVVVVLLSSITFLSSAFADTSSIYYVRYESYVWSPCSYNANGTGVCLAIACPLGGCTTPAEVTICHEETCVKNILKRRGKDHLTGIYRLTFWFDFNVPPTVQKMEVIESFDIIESQRDGITNTTILCCPTKE